MDNEELKKCIAVLVANLRGPGLDYRPMDYNFCQKLATFGEAVYFGKTCEEAEEIARGMD